jgi:hypothetical protein
MEPIRTNRLCLLALVISIYAFAVQPSSSAQDSLRKRAFLVGVSKYDKDGLTNLQYAESDIRALADELKKQGFETTMLLGPEATRNAIGTGLGRFIYSLVDLNKKDVVLIAFSGHGVQLQVEQDDRLVEDQFFCPVDALIGEDKTMISLSRLMQLVEKSSGSSQNLLVIDACRNNPAKGAKGIDGGTALKLPEKISVLFSSSAGTRSYESEKIKHGVFTHVLLRGLQGEARNPQNEVTWLNLAGYVMREVPRQTSTLLGDPNVTQEPNLIGNLVLQPVLARIAQDKVDWKSGQTDTSQMDNSETLLSGRWRTNEGAVYELIHEGDRITMRLVEASDKSQGEGLLTRTNESRWVSWSGTLSVVFSEDRFRRPRVLETTIRKVSDGKLYVISERVWWDKRTGQVVNRTSGNYHLIKDR